MEDSNGFLDPDPCESRLTGLLPRILTTSSKTTICKNLGTPSVKQSWKVLSPPVTLPETIMEVDSGPLEDYFPLPRGDCPLP